MFSGLHQGNQDVQAGQLHDPWEPCDCVLSGVRSIHGWSDGHPMENQWEMGEAPAQLQNSDDGTEQGQL